MNWHMEGQGAYHSELNKNKDIKAIKYLLYMPLEKLCVCVCVCLYDALIAIATRFFIESVGTY